MSKIEESRMRGESWAFRRGATENQMEEAWKFALDSGNIVVKNLHSHGLKWHYLPVHLLEELYDMYCKDCKIEKPIKNIDNGYTKDD